MSQLPGSAESSAVQQYLTLTLGQERFALPIEQVREVIEFNGLTEIPLMPAFIRGVINLRGAVVPVLDLAVRLGREPTQIGRRTCVVIVEVSHEQRPQLIGMLVDAVNDVLEAGTGELEQAPGFGARIRTDFMSGLLKHEERFLVVLNLDRVLSLDELAELAGHSALGRV